MLGAELTSRSLRVPAALLTLTAAKRPVAPACSSSPLPEVSVTLPAAWSSTVSITLAERFVGGDAPISDWSSPALSEKVWVWVPSARGAEGCRIGRCRTAGENRPAGRAGDAAAQRIDLQPGKVGLPRRAVGQAQGCADALSPHDHGLVVAADERQVRRAMAHDEEAALAVQVGSVQAANAGEVVRQR